MTDKGAIPMDTVSRKALLDWLDVEIDLSSGNDPVHKADRWAFRHVKREIERGKFDIPSTESEEEATVTRALFDVQMDELRRTKQDNERLRAALQLIKDHELMTRLEKTLVYRVADEAISTTSETAVQPHPALEEARRIIEGFTVWEDMFPVSKNYNKSIPAMIDDDYETYRKLVESAKQFLGGIKDGRDES